MVKVGEEEAGTITLNIAYNKFQANKDNKVTMQLLYMVQKYVNGQINQWNIIMNVSAVI